MRFSFFTDSFCGSLSDGVYGILSRLGFLESPFEMMRANKSPRNANGALELAAWPLPGQISTKKKTIRLRVATDNYGQAHSLCDPAKKRNGAAKSVATLISERTDTQCTHGCLVQWYDPRFRCGGISDSIPEVALWNSACSTPAYNPLVVLEADLRTDLP